MAQGLKIGDIVTVRKAQPVPKYEVAYQVGLTTVMPGQSGRILKATTGHSFIVEFDSHQVVLSAQALDILPEPPAKVVAAKGAKRGRKTGTKVKVVTVASREAISVAVSDRCSSGYKPSSMPNLH